MNVTATITFELRRRGFWSTLVRLPRVWRKHYRRFRRSNGPVISAYGVWLMARTLVCFVNR